MRLYVKNWEEFQHYKDRRPPWIKLHKTILDDYQFHCLPVASRALAPCIWLLASEEPEGFVMYDLEALAFRLHMTPEEVDEAIKPLIDKGFLMAEQDASNTLASNKQDAIPRALARDREETEGEGGADAPASANGKTSGTPKRKCRLPDGFEPNEKHHALAAELGVTLGAEFEQFKDYHVANASVFSDWGAALNTWLRNAKKFAKPHQTVGAPSSAFRGVV